MRCIKTTLIFLLHINLIIINATNEDADIDTDEDAVSTGETSKNEAPFQPEEFETPDAPKNVHFAEFFPQSIFPGKWIVSKAKKDGFDEDIAKYNGEWDISTLDTIVLKNDYCLIAKSKARHHAISTKLFKPFKFNAGKPLIVQYEVKLQKGLECGGAYIKLLTGDSLDLENFNDKTPYSIMFGPDKCGLQSKLHFIVKFKNPKSQEVLEHNGKQYEGSLDKYFTDSKSHLYTLVLNPDGAYKIYVDDAELISGDLSSAFTPPFVPPKLIDDPDDKKPADWDERKKIPDSNAQKPDDWDESAPEKIVDPNAQRPADWLVDEPEYIPDEKAMKPDDWDEEMDGKYEPPLIKNPKCETASGCGEWKSPTIPNPAYKGKWSPPMIDNPNYQGKWTPRKKENPDYFEIESIFSHMQPINALGIELWTMTEGIAFDNFLITDDRSVATSVAAMTFKPKAEAEERKSGKSSIVNTLVQTANDKPWLWAVYLLVVLIPVVLITIFCFSGSKKDASAQAKKSDLTSPDVVDDAAAEEGEQGASGSGSELSADEANADDQVKRQHDMNEPSTSQEAAGDSPSPAGAKSKKEHVDDEYPAGNSEGGSRKSPRRRAARKAD